ncbi:MAG: hybrid sensor histidine kinase/response regulator [Deltaproteobacteria bacterium]|nr:hybrid sensor histidine kinase/response regulator [Deltaproteobacteria bacterium]
MKKPKNLLVRFIGGSLIILFICVGSAALLFAISFSKKEAQRASISLQQVRHFFDFHYASLSEEMWAKSYDTIPARVARIAKEIGQADYELTLTDEMGRCILRASNKGKMDCFVMDELNAFISHAKANPDIAQKLHFDRTNERYVYFAPLALGATVRGFLFVTLSDPYHFYRGGLFPAIITAVPVLLLVLLPWFLWLLASNHYFLKPYLKEVEEQKHNEAIARLASQTAHDMRDPLSSIEKLVMSIRNVSPEKQTMLKSAVLQLRDIANSLLSHSRVWALENNKASKERTTELLSSLITQIVSEKRLQYNLRPAKITTHFDENSYGIFAKINVLELKRVLSNLINNAVEALVGTGTVTVGLRRERDKAVIEIFDTGKGIPIDILPRLGIRGMTFGKRKGCGLGLYHAKAVIESWGGTLSIRSQEKKGTQVQISFPKENPPAWFPAFLRIHPDTTIVVVDDQPAIHTLWQQRFEHQPMQNLLHFNTLHDFMAWHERQKPNGPMLYLCDYEFFGETQNGLDTIEALGIGQTAILVTSHYDEREVSDACANLGVKCLPKELAQIVPLVALDDVAQVQDAEKIL